MLYEQAIHTVLLFSKPTIFYITCFPEIVAIKFNTQIDLDYISILAYCQAQSQLQLSWTELALFSLWRTYAAQPTAYAAQPTAYAAQPTAYAAQPTAYAAQPGAYAAQPK